MTEKLTVQEILKQISDAIETGDNFDVNALKATYFEEGEEADINAILRELTSEYEPEKLERALPEIVEVVSFDSGGEGSAEDAPEIVYHYKPTDQYIGMGGWYASYHGTDWDNDGFKEWEPKQVTIYSPKS